MTVERNCIRIEKKNAAYYIKVSNSNEKEMMLRCMRILTDALDNVEHHVKAIKFFQVLTHFKYIHQIVKELNLHRVSGKKAG